MPLIITQDAKHVATFAETPYISLTDKILCNICTLHCLNDHSASSTLHKHKKSAEATG